MQIFSPEDAILWVDQNVKQIQGHTRKYLPFAPYDQEDFLQDAYEAALEAVNVSADRQIPFPACFWILFKGKVSDVTPNPGSKRNAGSSSPPSTFCDWTDFSRDEFDQTTMDDNAESLSRIDIDKVYPLIRQYLTPVEERALELLLGIHDGPMKIREAARHLDCSPANIRQALNRVCNRLSALVAQGGELSLHLVDGEIVKQQLHHEDNVPQPSTCPTPMEVVNSISNEGLEKVLKIRRDSPTSQNDSEFSKETNMRPHSNKTPHTHIERKRGRTIQSRQPSRAIAPLSPLNFLSSRHGCGFQSFARTPTALECDVSILKEMISSIPHGIVSLDFSLCENSKNAVMRPIRTEAWGVTPLGEITHRVVRMFDSSETRTREFYERSRAQSKDSTTRIIDFPTNLMAIKRQISSSQCRDGPGPFWSDFSPGACFHAISRSSLAA
jgi:hypothetical protein